MGFVWRCVETREVRYFRCKRNGCEYCLRVNAVQAANAAAAQRPERFVTLTLVGNEWPTIRNRVKRFVFEARAAGMELELWWTVEVNPKGTGHHVHALQHGRYMDLQALRGCARRAGLGWRWLKPERIRNVEDAAGYALKAATYVSKETAVSLAMNGGRVGHTTRGYWREPGGKRAAIARAVDEFVSGEGGKTWVIESEPWVDSSSSCSVRTDTGSSSTYVRPGRIVVRVPGAAGS